MKKGKKLSKFISIASALLLFALPLKLFAHEENTLDSPVGTYSYPPTSTPVPGEDYEYFTDAEGNLYYADAVGITPYSYSNSYSYASSTPVPTAIPTTPVPTSLPTTTQSSSSSVNVVSVNTNDASMTGEKFDGTGTVLDHTAENEKEFYTIKTADSKIFYIVVDHSKTSNNVYLLREINEEDLTVVSESMYASLQNQINGLSEQNNNTQPQPTKTNNTNGLLFPILLAALGFGGWYYFNNKDKFTRKKKDDNTDDQVIDALEKDAELDEEYYEDEELV